MMKHNTIKLTDYFTLAKNEPIDISLADVSGFIGMTTTGANLSISKGTSFINLKFTVMTGFILTTIATSIIFFHSKMTTENTISKSLNKSLPEQEVILPVTPKDTVKKKQPNGSEINQKNDSKIIADTGRVASDSIRNNVAGKNLKTKALSLSGSREVLSNGDKSRTNNDAKSAKKYKKNWILVSRKGLYGFIDTLGNEVVPLKYEEIGRLGEYKKDWILVSRDGLYGFIDTLGNEVVPLKYEDLSLFEKEKQQEVCETRKSKEQKRHYDKNVKFYNNGKWKKIILNNKIGFIDTATGTKVVFPKYDAVGYFGEYKKGWLQVFIGNQCGFIDTTGKEVVPVRYDKIGAEGKYKEGWFMVRRNQRCGFIDTTGKEVVPVRYFDVERFNEIKRGWMVVITNNAFGYYCYSRYGVIDTSGKEIIAPKYDKIGHFGEYYPGWALVKIDGKYGFIDTTGSEIVPVKYTKIKGFTANGFLKVKCGHKNFLLDKTGKEI